MVLIVTCNEAIYSPHGPL